MADSRVTLGNLIMPALAARSKLAITTLAGMHRAGDWPVLAIGSTWTQRIGRFQGLEACPLCHGEVLIRAGHRAAALCLTCEDVGVLPLTRVSEVEPDTSVRLTPVSPKHAQWSGRHAYVEVRTINGVSRCAVRRIAQEYIAGNPTIGIDLSPTNRQLTQVCTQPIGPCAACARSNSVPVTQGPDATVAGIHRFNTEDVRSHATDTRHIALPDMFRLAEYLRHMQGTVWPEDRDLADDLVTVLRGKVLTQALNTLTSSRTLGGKSITSGYGYAELRQVTMARVQADTRGEWRPQGPMMGECDLLAWEYVEDVSKLPHSPGWDVSQTPVDTASIENGRDRGRWVGWLGEYTRIAVCVADRGPEVERVTSPEAMRDVHATTLRLLEHKMAVVSKIASEEAKALRNAEPGESLRSAMGKFVSGDRVILRTRVWDLVSDPTGRHAGVDPNMGASPHDRIGVVLGEETATGDMVSVRHRSGKVHTWAVSALKLYDDATGDERKVPSSDYTVSDADFLEELRHRS